MEKPALKAKPQLPAKPSALHRPIHGSISSTTFSSTASGGAMSEDSGSIQSTDSTVSSTTTNASSSAALRSIPDDLESNKAAQHKSRLSVKQQLDKAFRAVPRLEGDLDADGNRVKYDIREDEEQFEKCRMIHQLLVQAGYCRAAIKGLTDFDKIIGGMTWCIQLCNVNIDIDLFYKDSLSIGQKIMLTEKIVRTLGHMKCPSPLEPHQIQGMDCIHIYPVMVWLVKQSIDFRKQMENYIKSFGVLQYNAEHNLQSDEDFITIVHSETTKKLVQELARRENVNKSLINKRDQLIRLIEEARVQTLETEKSINDLSFRLKDIEDQIDMVDSQKRNLGQSAMEQQQEMVDQRRPSPSAWDEQLLSDHFDLCRQGQELKNKIKTEKSRLKAAFEQMQDDGESEDEQQLQAQLEEEKQVLKQVSRRLAAHNKRLALLQRKVDDMPLQAELVQYRKRFVELYNQVSGKHMETKKLFVLNNQLENLKNELLKEIHLLDSIQSAFNLTQLNKGSNRTQFIRQFEDILDNIGSVKGDLKQKADHEQQCKNRLEAKLQSLLDTHREYYELLKQLRKEIKRNEQLASCQLDKS